MTTMQTAEAVRAAGYVRVSQERAARNGYGLGAQEQDVRRFVEYKNWPFVDLYREEGVSGYRKDRPALDRLLADAKAGRFNVAVFPSIDRAGRSVRDVIEIDQALRAAGVDTVFLREGVDTSTPTGELFRNIMASLAEFEGRVIYERLSKGKRRKAAEGGYTGGWVPYGYRRTDERTIAVVPDEAVVVERIFRLAADGRSLPSIAKTLRDENAPTRNGGAWRPSTIQGMLRNRFYTGRVEHEGDFIRAQHGAIVSDPLFQACM
ncbi:MAG: recombinase family protein [Planctomycetes bacterium]|nr:recombinase family protein [Planctomycetota bacterium]